MKAELEDLKIFIQDCSFEYQVYKHTKDLWTNTGKLAAVKYYKVALNIGLKEAKDEVEELCKYLESPVF